MFGKAWILPLAVALSSCGTSAGKDAPTTTPDGDAGTVEQPTVVRFIAMGDTGKGTSKQQKVGNTISAFCAERGCDFIQLLGDNLYETGAESVDDPVWKKAFETPYAAIDVDFWVVLGNHDYGGAGAGNEFDKGKNEVAYSAKSPKWKLPAPYWHSAPPTGHGKVEIFGLDTNMILYNKATDQKRDFPQWLENSTAEWKIAVGHHPYLSNGPHGNAGEYDGETSTPYNGARVKTFLDETICGKVDLYLSGHDHSRQWMNESCSGTELAVSGAGAETTSLGGKNPSLFESLELGFLYIVIDGKTLTAEFIDEAGNTEFTHTIQKP